MGVADIGEQNGMGQRGRKYARRKPAAQVKSNLYFDSSRAVMGGMRKGFIADTASRIAIIHAIKAAFNIANSFEPGDDAPVLFGHGEPSAGYPIVGEVRRVVWVFTIITLAEASLDAAVFFSTLVRDILISSINSSFLEFPVHLTRACMPPQLNHWKSPPAPADTASVSKNSPLLYLDRYGDLLPLLGWHGSLQCGPSGQRVELRHEVLLCLGEGRSFANWPSLSR